MNHHSSWMSVLLLSLHAATVHPVDRFAATKQRFHFQVRYFDERVEDDKVVSYCQKYLPHSADDAIDVFRTMRQELAPFQGRQRETWLQVMAIGDVALVGIPAEYFTGLGADIKNRSPFPHTVIVELASDWIGYLPDREAHLLGGYQTWMGLHSYAQEGTGERVADQIVDMLQQLFSPS